MATNAASRNTTKTKTKVFEAPGPGSWQQDPAHWPRPVTPWLAEVFPGAFARGFAESTRRYGLLVSHFEAAVIGGFMYYRLVPALDPENAEQAAAEAARRFEASRAAFETRLWREDLEAWEARRKPDSVRRNRRLQSVEVAALGDAELARHLARCGENHAVMVYRHHEFNMAAMLPVGHFLARTSAWTGLPNGEILGLLRGSSPVSNGIAAQELRDVGEALRAAGIGEDFEPEPTPAWRLERLRTLPGRVGEAVRAYLAACGQHLAGGYDVSDATVVELPEAVLRIFWSAALEQATPESHEEEAARRTARVRDAVPPAHRAEFDALLAEARHVNRLRDERGLFTDLWAGGISRRAILEAGRRLAVRGRLDDERLVFEASPGEMAALLDGATRPDGGELCERRASRLAVRLENVPPLLGDPPAPPPPLDGLPPHARAAAEALAVVVEEILGTSTDENEARVLRGKAVSPGTYEGRARVVAGPADFDRLRAGDVLVTASTSASFNVVLPLLGAIVTDRGALLSHAAIVAREYGIPGVVGTREATRAIPDGARVRVDGSLGTVEVLP